MIKYPGEVLGYSHEYQAGSNCYDDQIILDSQKGGNHIRSSGIGLIDIRKENSSNVINITPSHNLTPKDIIHGIITKITKQQAYVNIVIPQEPSYKPALTFNGIIRHQDIRASLKDLITIPQAFQPGDIVK